MKRIKTLLCMLLICVVCFSGCNYDMMDTTYDFDYAYIFKPDGSILVEGKVQSWKDYDDSEQIQVKIGGKTYLTTAMNCVLVAK